MSSWPRTSYPIRGWNGKVMREGRPKVIRDVEKDLGFCYFCDRLVKKGTRWTLWVIKYASRLVCETCQKK